MNLRLPLLLIFLLFSAPAWCQQTFFNVPMGEVAEKGHWSVETQSGVRMGNGKFQSQIAGMYGLGAGWEAALNLYQFTLLRPQHGLIGVEVNDDIGHETEEPQLLVGLTKRTTISHEWGLAVGGQVGFSPWVAKPHLLGLGYVLASYLMANEKVVLTAGPYYGNQAYLGQQAELGLMAGAQATLWDKLIVEADLWQGHNSRSVAVPGLGYKVSDSVELTAGYQFPLREAGQAVVFEVRLKR